MKINKATRVDLIRDAQAFGRRLKLYSELLSETDSDEADKVMDASHCLYMAVRWLQAIKPR